MNTQIILLTALSIAAVAQNIVYWNYLPDRVAIHFGANGQANDWLDKTGATWLMVLLQVGLPWLLSGIAHAIRYLPVSLINIPNREVWLVGEQREPTLRYVGSMVTTIAILESLLIAAVNHLAFTANRLSQPLNTPVFIAVLAIFLAATLALVVMLLRRFSRRPVYN